MPQNTNALAANESDDARFDAAGGDAELLRS